MRNGLVALGLLLLGASVAAHSADLQGRDPQPASVHVTHAQILQLSTTGFFAPPYTVAPGAIPGDWTDVALPHAPRLPLLADAARASANRIPTTITYYRMQVRGPAQASEPLSIYIPRWKSDGTIAVYADSRLLLYQSHANLIWNGSNNPLWIALDGVPGALPREILVRIQHLRGSGGGGLSSVRVGHTEALGWRYRTRSWLQTELPLMNSAAFLALGIFALFVWLKRRHEQTYLLLFALAVINYIRTLQFLAGTYRLPISDEWFGWLTVNALFWAVAIIHLFLVRLHERSQLWLTRVVVGLAATSTLLTLPVIAALPKAMFIAPAMYVALLSVTAVAFAVGLWNSWLARSRAALLLASWSLIGFLFGLYDWLLQVNLMNIENAYLLPYHNMGLFFIFCYIMFQRYVDAIRNVEQVNASLAQRLQARETELAESYARLRVVERRQMLSQERQRLMQDMHDGLGSSLHTALRVVEGGRISEREIAEVLKSCIDDLKLAIDSMEPVEADLLLLLATLRYRLQARFESSGIQLHWDVADVPPLDWLDPRNSLHILRILQEAFANIMKHTRATQIRVGTSVQSDRILVTIADDGPGFDFQQALQAGGKGLSNQLRRAQAIGAEIRWNCGAAGTCLTLLLPRNRRAAHDLKTPQLQPA